MSRSEVIIQILKILIISSFISFSPVLLFEFGEYADTTGAGAYVVLFLITIPLGLLYFILSIIFMIRRYHKSAMVNT